MIDPTAKLSVSRQAVMLGISRGAVYYRPRPVSDADQRLMNRIDRLHTDHPFAGSRMLQSLLVQEGFKVGRKHVRTLMKRMGIEPIYRRPNTSKPVPGHKIYPYLARETCPSPDPIRSGAPISATSRCAAGSSTLWPSWTGTAARC